MIEAAVRLRQATAEDRAFAFEVTRRALGPYVEAWIGWDHAEMRALHERRYDPALTRVVVVDGRDVGVLTVRDEPDRVRLQQLFLLPEAQGRGIGAELLRRVVDEAAGAAKSVVLRVLCTNPRARAFYERHGFRNVCATASHWMLSRPYDGLADGERFVTIDGARIWVRVEGAGPVAVLLHGGPGASDYLGPVAEMLRDVCTVVRYEQRGCGRSDDVGPRTVERNVRDLEALRAEIGAERMALVGHSWGAALGLAYALEHPAHVTRFAYLAGVGVDLDWKAAHNEASRTRADLDPGCLYPHNVDLNRATQSDWERSITQPGLDARLRGLDVPVMLVHGTGDLRPGGSAEALAARLPRARFHWIEGADHFLWLSHSDDVRALLRPFLTG